VANVVESTGSNQINRRDLTREVAITGNVSGRSAGEVSADIKTAMDSIAMPPGYSYKFSGSVKDMAEAFAYALSALALAVIFIYMILASQFKSFFQQKEMPEVIKPSQVKIPSDKASILNLYDLGLGKLLQIESKAEFRRLIQQGAVEVNSQKVSDINYELEAGKEYLIKAGKRRLCKVSLKLQ